MKGSDKMAVYVATFIFVIIGYLLYLVVRDILTPVFTNLNIDILTPARIGLLVFAIAWFVVTFLTGWGSTKWLEEGQKTGIMSLFFFILWIIASFALVIAKIVELLLGGSSAVINLDIMLDGFFVSLPLALAPALAAILSVSNKTTRRD